MSKKPDTIYTDDQDNENIFDQEFIEEQFESELTEWRMNEQSSDYCSRN